MTDLPSPNKFSRFIPLLAWLTAGLAVLACALKVIGLGYLPPDDALRHAARAVTGRPWAEILVLGDVMKMEHNFGWHLLLRAIHLGTGAGADGLVVFSVASLFVVVGWSGMVWLRRPEAWLVVLILIAAGTGLPQRFMLGRPFMLTITALITVLMLWQRRGQSAPNWRDFALMTGVIAAASFVHGCWYLWAVAVLAFFLAQQWRWAFAFAVSWIFGVVIGGVFTGHPIDFTMQALDVALKAFGGHQTQRTMQSEYQPVQGDCFALILLAGLCGLRALTKPNLPAITRNPAFWLALVGWALGFKAGRFWLDWGWPALLVLAAWEIQAWMEVRVVKDSLHRLALVVGLAGTLFLAVTNDINSRWTWNLGTPFLTPNEPELAGWLPEDGGVIYSAEMAVFYRTFYKNPDAKWRYILGYEPIFMPREDFQTYESILANHDNPATFLPWVQKMKPADRLIGRMSSGLPAAYRQLEWNSNVGGGLCIGRLPSANSPKPTP